MGAGFILYTVNGLCVAVYRFASVLRENSEMKLELRALKVGLKSKEAHQAVSFFPNHKWTLGVIKYYWQYTCRNKARVIYINKELNLLPIRLLLFTL